MSVTLTGYIEVPPERMDAIREGLKDHIRLTREEPGCLHFEVTENLEIPGRFDVDEAYVDATAFHFHQTRAKSSIWAEISEGIPRHYQVQGLDGK